MYPVLWSGEKNATVPGEFENSRNRELILRDSKCLDRVTSAMVKGPATECAAGCSLGFGADGGRIELIFSILGAAGKSPQAV